ncbi:exodeoxyribonuclease V subunit alpha [Corticibacter populi]|uniref:RecBCD enzyme subunit RecD n=1 Tax=Corticibacter populi TaxID=1550736 RepID=A0A3M6QS99_9BURK|nr:exodeoxyribonuclease V subunit alpha [Corticibacter populi]RMX05721.1 exodeoxyribonuclease V subunit alpha [Corticibacter populi]RZS30985.1 DNA helicase/exodeoxyribonuclease V alpha subunit [Corticibacter populi]
MNTLPLFPDSPETRATTPAVPALLAQLWQWADAGWLRRLDAAFAQWLAERDATGGAVPLLAAALLAHMEGKGHSCLLLQDLHSRLPQWLDWPADPAAQQALTQLQTWLPRDAAGWQAALAASPLVELRSALSVDQTPPAATAATDAQKDCPPLVLQPRGGTLRLYLRRYHQYEQRVAQALLARARQQSTFPAPDIAEWLARLFPATASQPDAAINWQKAACALALHSRLGIITGGPGTGKTYTAARLITAALALADDPAQLRIRLAAPTGKAAARLTESLQQALQSLPPGVQEQPALLQALQQLPAARTLHSLLGSRPDTRQLRHHAGNPLELDWLIVDEASMVHLEMMAALLDALPPHAHLVLLGDKDQLASVEAGSVLGDLCGQAELGHYGATTAQFLQQASGHPPPAAMCQPAGAAALALAQSTVMLRESRRFGGAIGQLAQAVQHMDGAAMARILAGLQQNHGAAHGVFWKEPAGLAEAARLAWQGHGPAPGYQPLAEALLAAPRWPAGNARGQTPVQAQAQPPQAPPAWLDEHAAWVRRVLAALERFRILCATREGEWGVAGMNALVMQALRQHGLPVRMQGWFAGRVVMVTRNDAALGVFNGDIGIALPAPQERQSLRVYFTGGGHAGPDANTGSHAQPRSITVSRLQHAETAYAMTVHKSQGSEFEHVLLVLPGRISPVLSRELLYTGLTRARAAFSYLAPAAGIWEHAMRQRTFRASGLADWLQNTADAGH